MKPYKLKWSGRKNAAEDYRRIDAQLEAIDLARSESKIFRNYNQYLVTKAIMSVDIVGQPIDKSAISAVTKLSRSSVYNAINKLERENLVTSFSMRMDNKRRYVEASIELTHHYLDFLDTVKSLQDLMEKHVAG
ncbi:MAG: hypothetical protein JKX94_09435 [Sneathiella sp.]|nr:hypothetical protein [Sneathiella sp.]